MQQFDLEQAAFAPRPVKKSRFQIIHNPRVQTYDNAALGGPGGMGQAGVAGAGIGLSFLAILALGWLAFRPRT